MRIQKQRYQRIDGLRTFSAFGIVLMHVLANGNYGLRGFVFEHIVPAFTNLVFLFMTISAFSMCCGYYEKVLHGRITPAEFYGKRYRKVLPFFACLCLLDMLLAPSVNALYEVLANLTLCIGMLPDTGIEVIGVGWFLGLVFVFYFLFPFYCVLLENKRRAWFTFAASLVLHYLCIVRFHLERTNIIYSSPFFVAGGLIYLYREPLRRFADRHKGLLTAAVLGATILYFRTGPSSMPILLWCVTVMIAALATNEQHSVLGNPITGFFSAISMEIYLCHMVIYRGMELFGLTTIFVSPLMSYCVTCAGCIGGAAVFSVLVGKILKKVMTLMGW